MAVFFSTTASKFAPFLFVEFFHPRHQAGIHAAKLGPPFVKAGAAHPVLTTKPYDWHTTCFTIAMFCALLYFNFFIRVSFFIIGRKCYLQKF
jgi:hypothetical protein